MRGCCACGKELEIVYCISLLYCIIPQMIESVMKNLALLKLTLI